LAQYSSVNAAANQTAQTPFQDYTSGQFVAPVNAQQTAGITNTNAAAEEAQPYYGAATSTLGSAQSGVNPVNAAATGLAGASAEQVNAQPLTGQDINQYLSPYLGDVLGTTNALANQNNSIAQSGALGTAISSGAFGGDRTGIAAANLNQQNSLAEQSTDANILNTGYNTALSTAQQQQGVNLSAGQANRAALGSAGSELASIGSTAYGEGANTASELGSLGSGAQAAGLAGAQAQIGAGTLQQQTAQAQDTAEYNQFLQQQSYPFQVDQFLANIAEGTGALSGSTTTTTQPGGFFSDKRLKHDIKKIGKLFDGQEIYSYKMHGDPRTHIGLIAQKVEKKHPEAVGLARGYKIVDYGKATEEAANRSHFAGGGLARRAYASGGSPDLADILTAHEAMYGSSPGGSGAYGLAAGSIPRGGSQRVPAGTSSGAQLHPAQGSTQRPTTGMQNVTNLSNFGNTLAKDYQGVKGVASNAQGAYQQNQADSSMATTNQQIANDPTMQGLLGAAPDLSTASPSTASDVSSISSMAGDDMALGDDADAMAMFANRGGRFALGGAPGAMPARPPMRPPGGLSAGAMPMMGNAGLAARPRGYASGGGPYSNDVGAGSTELSIPTASGSSGMGGLAAAPPPAQSGSSDPLAGLDKYDPAMQGIMASTQGQIKFDYGGVVPGPQTDVPQSLDIPDQSGAGGGGGGNKLAVATPPAGPSAGQQDMQDIMEVAGIVAMFANRGGRIGKDHGGSISDDSDPDLSPIAINPNDTKLGLAGASDTMLPEATVTGQRPDPVTYTGGVSAPPPAPANPTAPDAPNVPADAKPDKDTPSTWTKIMDGLHAAGLDKATNVVPLLTGLAAMGTAPTKHLGVALAAGLGAGAQAYLPAQQQAADIQGQQIQNQMGQVGLQAYRGAMASVGAPQGGVPQPKAHSQPTQAPDDPTGLPAFYQAKYAVNPAMTDQEMANVTRAQIAGGFSKNPGLAQAAMVPYQNRLRAQTFQNQQAAQLERDGAYQTYLQATAAGDTATAQKAAATVNAIHPWTGDKYDNDAGSMRNSRTGQPLIGSVSQALTPEQQQDAYQKALTQANEPVTVGAGLPAMRWQVAHAASPEAYAASQVPGGYTPPSSAVAPPTAPTRGPGAAPRPSSPAAPLTPYVPTSGPLKDALSDPSYRLKPPPIPKATDQPSLEAAKKLATDQAAATVGARTELLKDSQDATKTAAQSLVYLKAAKQIMDSKEVPTTGPLANIVQQASRVLPMGHDDATNYQELAKYLGNAALQNAKATYGARMTQSEVKLQLEELSPDVAKTPTAINDLLDANIRNAQYAIDSAHRTRPYLAAGNDPQSFEDWNNAYFNRSTAVNQPNRPGQQTSGRTVVRTGTYNGKKVTQYSDGTIE
jgi:hypothetical protein